MLNDDTVTVTMRGSGYVTMNSTGYKLTCHEAVRMSNMRARGNLIVVLSNGWNEEHAQLAIKMAESLYSGHKLVLKVGRKKTVVKKGASVERIRKALKV